MTLLLAAIVWLCIVCAFPVLLTLFLWSNYFLHTAKLQAYTPSHQHPSTWSNSKRTHACKCNYHVLCFILTLLNHVLHIYQLVFSDVISSHFCNTWFLFSLRTYDPRQYDLKFCGFCHLLSFFVVIFSLYRIIFNGCRKFKICSRSWDLFAICELV